MSGLPHPFEASCDALPNRTGGGMNVREALEEILRDHVGRYARSDLAPIIERALRVTAESMENYYLSCGVPRNRKRSKSAMEKCVTAGVAAMMEES